MRKAKTLLPLVLLLVAVPSVSRAGLDVFPADGPAPEIKIVPPKPIEYKIAKGDTVASIAKKFSVDSKKLLEANGITDPRKLKAGKTLKIPGTTAPAVASAPAAKPVPLAAAKPQAGAPATPPAATPPTGNVTVQTIATSQVASSKPDAAARKAAKKGESLDPGVVEEAPVKGKKGRRKKETLPVCPPPTITIDDKTRASFGKTGVIMNDTNVPQDVREGFLRYANKWIDELDRIGVGTFANKKIRQVGSQWEATYRVVLRESLGAEVKKVDHEAEDTPYVGHITYVQRVFTSEGPTKQAALQGPYQQKDECVREIFSYSGSKRAWR